MARIARLLLLGCLAVALAEKKHDDLSSDGGPKELIMLEIEPLGRNHGKRAADPASQALFGVSPGQYVVRSGDNAAQPEIPPEYLGLLQQLLAQSRSAVQQTSPQPPVIQQLLVARDPEPSAARFSTTPDPSQFLYAEQASASPPPPTAAASGRPPLPPDSRLQQQLQQLYHDQRQTPRPQQALSPSAAHSVHEARLRASLAGENPDYASLQPSPAPTQADLEDALFQQQLQRLAVQAQQEQAQVQAQAQAEQSPVQQVLQRQSVQPQVFPPAPTARQQQYQQQVPVSTPVPRQTTAAPVFIPEPQEQAPQQYLRETTRPRGRRPYVESPRRLQQLESPAYLSTPAPTATAQNDDLIASLLGQSRRGFFDNSPSTTAATLPSRSSIFVSTTSTLKGSKPGSGITIEELGSVPTAGDDNGAVPVVRLPTPEGHRPLTEAELQALIAAGFKVTPLDGAEESAAPSVPYYQPSTKRQRSYATPVPPVANQVAARQQTRKQPPAAQEEKPQRRPQFVYRTQEQEELVGQAPPSFQQESQESQPTYQPQDLQLFFQQQRQEEAKKQAVSTQRPPAGYQPEEIQLVFQRQGGEKAQSVSTTQQPQAAYQPQDIQLFFQQQQQQTSSSTQQPPVAYQPQDIQLFFQQQQQQTSSSTQQPPVAYQPQDLQLVFQRQGGELAQPEGGQLYDSPATRLSPIVVPEQQEVLVAPRRRPAGSRRSRQRSRGYRPSSSQESEEQSFVTYDSEPAPSNSRGRSVRQRSRRPQPSYES